MFICKVKKMFIDLINRITRFIIKLYARMKNRFIDLKLNFSHFNLHVTRRAACLSSFIKKLRGCFHSFLNLRIWTWRAVEPAMCTIGDMISLATRLIWILKYRINFRWRQQKSKMASLFNFISLTSHRLHSYWHDWL